MTPRDIIIYDLFHMPANELLILIQPLRTNQTVAQQLIESKHMWSEMLNSISLDSQELTEMLVDIGEEVGMSNTRFRSNLEKNREPYMLRKMNVSEFLMFIESGSKTFSDLISMMDHQNRKKMIDTGELVYFLDKKLIPQNSKLEYLDPEDVMKIVLDKFGDIFEEQQTEKRQDEILDQNQELPPIIFTFVGNALYEIQNQDCLEAAYLCKVKEVPVSCLERFGELLSFNIVKEELTSYSTLDVSKFSKNIKLEELEHVVDYHIQKNETYIYNKAWITVGYDEEKDNFNKAAKKFGKTNTEFKKAYHQQSFHQVQLTDSIWKNLKNTKSSKIKNIKEVEKIVSKELDEYRKVLFEFIYKPHSYCPVIVAEKTKGTYDYYLIAGEYRLLLSKVFDIKPDVVIIYL